jgi:hypothetical protein
MVNEYHYNFNEGFFFWGISLMKNIHLYYQLTKKPMIYFATATKIKSFLYDQLWNRILQNIQYGNIWKIHRNNIWQNGTNPVTIETSYNFNSLYLSNQKILLVILLITYYKYPHDKENQVYNGMVGKKHYAIPIETKNI